MGENHASTERVDCGDLCADPGDVSDGCHMRLDELYLPESPEFLCASHDIAEAQCYLARLVNGADLDVERLCAASMTQALISII